MVTQYDEKGKFFTQVISKKPVQVIIQTTHHTIQGTIYVRPSERVIDELNESQVFKAVTDATILDETGKIIYKSNFLSLNINQIIWIIPEDEVIEPKS